MSYSSNNKSSYDDFNLSENNLDASIGSSSSSKAVLAALRALQDKIRRLEAERSTALDESNQLRHQLKQQEIEFEHVKQRDQLQSQKNISEVRNAYDKLLSDKAELEIRLSKLEDKSKVFMSNSEDMQVKIHLLEEEKHASSMKIRELENQRNSIESQIKLAQIKEEEMSQSLQWENKRHEESLNFTHRRVQSLQEELQDICKEKGVSDAKLIELDGLVTQLLAVNQSLVKQLSNDSGINAIKKITATTTTKKKKIIKKPKAPKVASIDTLSSQLNKHPNNEKMVLMNHANHLKEIESLKNMHKMYSNIARNIKSSSKKETFATDASDGATHASSDSSYYKKNNTRLSRKKAQMRSDQQQQLQQQQPSYSSSTSVPAMSNTQIRPSSVYSGSSNTNSHHYSNNYINSSNSSSMDVRLPKPSVSFDYDHENSRGLNMSSDRVLDMSSDRDEEYSGSSSSSHPNYPQYRSDNNNNNMPRSIMSTSKNSNSGLVRSSFAHDQAEVKDVISSLEEEFDALNAQYRSLLSNVQAHPPSTSSYLSSSSSTGSSIVRDIPSHVNPDTIQAQAEEIVTVIQKLHKKGEQIRSLKNASP